LVLPNFITVYPAPAPQAIQQSGDTLSANQGAVSYQWYFNGVIIPGATGYFYVTSQSGDYNVVCADANGCEVEAVIFDVFSAIQDNGDESDLSFFPSPAISEVTVKSKWLRNPDAVIRICNTTGENTGSGCFSLSDVTARRLDVSSLASGLYYLELKSGEKIYHAKFIKQ
jgi:hypothetical protein